MKALSSDKLPAWALQVWAGCLILLALVGFTSPASHAQTNSQIVTNVTESNSKGKYKRVTETFENKSLVSRKEEVALNPNGHIDYVIIKRFDEGKVNFLSVVDKTRTNATRCYYHNDRLLAEEVDSNLDGFFETLVLFNERGQPIEAFRRSKDGDVTQYSAEEMSKIKTAFSLIE